MPHLPPTGQPIRRGGGRRRAVRARVVLAHVDGVALRLLGVGGALGRRDAQREEIALHAAPAAAGLAQHQADAVLGAADAAAAVQRQLHVLQVAAAALLEEAQVAQVRDAAGRQVHLEALVRHGVGPADLVVLPRPAADVAGFLEGGGGGRQQAEVGDLAAPGEDALVVGLLDDLLLQAQEGLLALAVEQGHVDVEDAQQAVRHVLDAAALARRRPGHALRDARRRQGPVVEEALEADARRGGDVDGQLLLLADEAPLLVVEDDVLRREELLQRPPARVPVGLAERFARGGGAGELAAGGGGGREVRGGALRRAGVVVFLVPRDVEQVDVAFFGRLVPAEHAVDGFGELGGGGLVDAAGVDPDPVVFVREGFLARRHDFGPALGLALFAVDELAVA